MSLCFYECEHNLISDYHTFLVKLPTPTPPLSQPSHFLQSHLGQSVGLGGGGGGVGGQCSIKYEGHEYKGNHQQVNNVLISKQILPINTIGTIESQCGEYAC